VLKLIFIVALSALRYLKSIVLWDYMAHREIMRAH